MTSRAFENAIRGDHEARGLVEMAIAILRQNPNYSGKMGVAEKYQQASESAIAIAIPLEEYSDAGVIRDKYQESSEA